MIVLILSILGSVFSLGGNILIAHKKRSGWWIWSLFDNIEDAIQTRKEAESKYFGEYSHDNSRLQATESGVEKLIL